MSIKVDGRARYADTAEARVCALLARMTLAEKVGQLTQVGASEGYPPDYLGDRLRAGLVGSVLNQVDVDVNNELQRIAVEETRLGLHVPEEGTVASDHRSL